MGQTEITNKKFKFIWDIPLGFFYFLKLKFLFDVYIVEELCSLIFYAVYQITGENNFMVKKAFNFASERLHKTAPKFSYM